MVSTTDFVPWNAVLLWRSSQIMTAAMIESRTEAETRLPIAMLWPILTRGGTGPTTTPVAW